MITEEQIDQAFPLSSYRPGQKTVISKVLEAFESGKKFVFVEAPVGSGKSVIGYTIAQLIGDSYYLAPQKFLQNQLSEDFGEQGKHLKEGNAPLIELKGRNSYPCDFWRKALADKGYKWDSDEQKKRAFELAGGWVGCDKGECKRKKRSRLDYCESFCKYFIQLAKAINSQICLMNYHSFLYQTNFTQSFGRRRLLILDECLHPHTYIETDQGRLAIGNIVNKSIKCNVLSYNHKEKRLEYKPIVRWLKRSKQWTYQVLAGNRVFYATADHKIYTPQGKRKLSELNVGDLVIINEPSITETQKQLLLGSLLGDANVHTVKPRGNRTRNIKKGIRARVRFQHGPKQSWYTDWKYNLIKEHVNTPPKTVSNKGFTKTLRRFSTKCNLNGIVRDTIVNNKKTINQKWLDQVSSLGLAIWLMDDGSITNGCIALHTEGYSLRGNNILCDWLNNKWGIACKVLSYKRKDRKNVYYYIVLSREGTRALAGVVAKYIPEKMRYKLPKGNYEQYDKSLESKRSDQISEQPILLIKKYQYSTTYDLEVADNHNFFAGSTLVSNCHQSEDVLSKFVEISLSDRHFQTFDIRFPKYETVKEYVNYFNMIELDKKILDRINWCKANDDMKGEDEWKNLLFKYGFLLVANPDEWVCNFEDKGPQRIISIKPIFVDEFANKYIFDYADHILLMSSTILSKEIVGRSLGIDLSQSKFFKMGNTFPTQNRPIIYTPAGSMSYTNKAETMPKMIKAVNEICKKHENERGIIHTHTFEISQTLAAKCDPEVRSRFLLQRDFDGDKQKLLEEHRNRPNTVIVAPAMHEGLDLKDDLGRFQMICKVPYPSKNDPQIAARMDISSEHYAWMTACKIIQSYGRVVRHKEDWGKTYILDGDFKRFFSNTKDLLPSWFQEAVIW